MRKNKFIYEGFWDNVGKVMKHNSSYDQDAPVKTTNITPFVAKNTKGVIKVGHENKDSGDVMVNHTISKAVNDTKNAAEDAIAKGKSGAAALMRKGADTLDPKEPEKTGIDKVMSKVREYGGAARDWAAANPGKATAIGAATAAGLGALAFRKKIAEKLRKNK